MAIMSLKNLEQTRRKVKQLSVRREIGDRILTSRGIEKVISKNKDWNSIFTLYRTKPSNNSSSEIHLIQYEFNIGGIFNYKTKEVYSSGTLGYAQADERLRTNWRTE